MTALAGFLGINARHLSDLIFPITYAESATLALGKHNIRDNNFETRIGVGFLLDSSYQFKVQNTHSEQDANWMLVKGVIPRDQSITDWFRATGLYQITSRSGIAVVTSGKGQPVRSAPLSRSGGFIGGAVGYISDYLDSVSPDRDKSKGDGVTLLQSLSTTSLLEVPYSMHLALISLDGQTLRLIRSVEHSQRKESKPYIYYAEADAMLVFGSFEENISQLGVSISTCTLGEGTFIDIELKS